MAISSCTEVVAIEAEGRSGVAVGLVNIAEIAESTVRVKQATLFNLMTEGRQPWSPT